MKTSHTQVSGKESALDIDPEDDEFEEVQMNNNFKGNSDTDSVIERQLPKEHYIGDPRSDPTWKSKILHEYDKALTSDSTCKGKCRFCVVSGTYYTILRCSHLIAYFNTCMIACVTYLGTYERGHDLNDAFLTTLGVSMLMSIFFWVIDYARAIQHETRHYNSRISIYFIAEGQLSCLDVFFFGLHLALFGVLTIVCIAFLVQCDTPDTLCYEIDQFLLNGNMNDTRAP